MRLLRLNSVKKVPNTSNRYDIQVRGTHNFFADGMLVHNSFCAINYIPGLNHPEMFGETGCITVGSKGLSKQGLVFKNNSNNDGNVYVQTLRKLLAAGLEERFRTLATSLVGKRFTIFGEVYGGSIQDLKYGITTPEFRMFDMLIDHDRWQPRDELGFANEFLDIIKPVPILYDGPFDLAAIENVRDGATVVSGDNIREGVVVTSRDQSCHPTHGRRIAKFISPNYLTRKVKNGEATEYQ